VKSNKIVLKRPAICHVCKILIKIGETAIFSGGGWSRRIRHHTCRFQYPGYDGDIVRNLHSNKVYTRGVMRLLTKPGGNAKLTHGTNGYLPYVLHLAPARSAGEKNVCPDATPECIALCLNVSGRSMMFPNVKGRNPILDARIRKTQFFFQNRTEFLQTLRKEIKNAVKRSNGKAVFRLNGTSDLDFLDIIREFPTVQFYDYTKSPQRMHEFLLGILPPNYHLTFSFSGRNADLCRSFLARGGNVAVAFARPIGVKYNRPETWEGYSTIDGDASDLRFLDSKGIVVALKAKGTARKVSGNRFIVGS